jgi:threonine/homoserine/homoserine lactone efflux protein
MKTELLLPFLTYAIVTSITPGPNNASASSAGMKMGFRKSLPYLLGILTGFFIVLLTCGLLLDLILDVYCKISLYLKWVGVLYMFWLAAVPFIPQKVNKSIGYSNNYSFLGGMILQLVNIKVILYGITIYSTFTKLIGYSTLTVFTSSVFLTIIGFGCLSIWTSIGSTFSHYFKNRYFYLLFNGVMAILLIYSAISILR